MARLTRLRFASLAILAFLVLAVPLVNAGASSSAAASLDPALRQALLDLTSHTRVLCFAAHPDDEDYPALAWFRFALGCETHDLQATRGEGGQNETGPELYAELAVIRDHESRRAAETVGAHFHSLALPDFGFSKSATETFEFWGREEALRRLVHALRLIRPHVVITHHGFLKDHGHHQACALLIREAFHAAADPGRFPEQINDCVSPWQVRKLYVRRWEGPGETAVPVGDLLPFRDISAETLGALALQQHHSQGVWPDPKSDPEPHAYDLVLADGISRGVTGFLDGLDPLADLPEPDQAFLRDLAATARAFLDAEPVTGLPDLAATLTGIRDRWLQGDPARADSPLRLEVDEVLVRMLGLEVLFESDTVIDDATTPALPGYRIDGPADIVTRLKATPRLQARSGEEARLLASCPGRVMARPSATAHDIPRFAPAPLRHRTGDFNLGRPMAFLDLEIQGEDGAAFRILRQQSFTVLPEVSARIVPERIVVRDCGDRGHCSTIRVPVEIACHASDPGEYRVAFHGPPGWPNITPLRTIRFSGPGETHIQAFDLHAAGRPGLPEVALRVEVWKGARPIASATGTVRMLRVDVPDSLRVGVVRSYDDTLPDALRTLDVDFTLLDEAALAGGRLESFDTICIDIRAYAKREDLRRHNPRVLEYVHQGGNLVVFYQKTFEWNPDQGNPVFAPYPLTLLRDRVTREDAPVRILQPDHPLLVSPNRLTEADWEGWVQERGLYFPGSRDDAYTALLSSHDPGEPPLDGGYLVADYGRGTYLYTSYVWYRQLRAGHPGAYRAFANMLAYPETRHGHGRGR